MAVLVTGGAGYIGSHMAFDLVDHGERVVILDDLSTGVRENTPADALLVQGDVRDRALVASLLREHEIDTIVHFAGSIIVPESVVDPMKYYLNNTAASAELIAAAVACGVERFIFSSTAAVYGEPESVPVPEDAPLMPRSPYGTSKMMTELMLRDAGHAHGLRHAILRYFNVAGADPAGRTGQSTRNATHLIKVACQAAIGLRDRLDIFGDDYPTPDGTCVRDYIHVCDLVAAHRLALHQLREGHPSFTVNCGYGHGYSVKEVVAAVRAVSGAPLEVRVEKRRAGDPAILVANADRARKLLGWRPAHEDLSAIVRHALAWERRLNAVR